MSIAARSSADRSTNSIPIPGERSFWPPRVTRTTRPLAVICAVPTNASTEAVVNVPRALLVHLRRTRASAWGVPVSIEVARRVRAREPLAPSGARVSVETRSAVAAELRP